MDFARKENIEGGSVMNDLELQQKVQSAFDTIEVSDAVKRNTLDAYDRLVKEKCGNNSNKRPVLSILRSHKMASTFSALAACLVIAAIVFGVQVQTTPTAFVDIDVNPSIEIELNRFDKVVNVKGINKDGTSVVSDLSLTGLSYEEALKALTQSPSMAAYLKDDSFIQLSVTSDSQNQEAQLTNISENYLASIPYNGSCSIVSAQMRQEAHAYGMGCGRYAATLELTNLDPTIAIEDCANLSMSEIHNELNTHRNKGEAASHSAPQNNAEHPSAHQNANSSQSDPSGEHNNQNGNTSSGSGNPSSPQQGKDHNGTTSNPPNNNNTNRNHNSNNKHDQSGKH